MAGAITPGNRCYGASELFLPSDVSMCHAPSLAPQTPGPIGAAALDRTLVTRDGRVLALKSRGEGRQELTKRLANLTRLRSDVVKMYAGIRRELDESLEAYKGSAEIIDITAMLAQVFVGLAQLVQKSIQAIKLSGRALEEANKELLKKTFEVSLEPGEDVLKGLAANKVREKSDQGLLWAFGSALFDAYLNMTTPSFWAQVVGNLKEGKSWSRAVTTTPADVVAQAKAAVSEQELQMLRRIDERIEQTQKALRPHDRRPRISTRLAQQRAMHSTAR